MTRPPLPALLLIAVAAVQIGLARAGDLTAWKGGGFGMFSTLDHGAHRRITAVVEAPDRSEQIELPPSLEETAARAAGLPADWLLRRLAEALAARERRQQRPVNRVTLTVWTTDFDRDTLLANERVIRAYVYTTE